jgi:hypothetical protein
LRLRVWAACFAARDRAAWDRLRALERACRARLERLAAECPSRRSAFEAARERVGEGEDRRFERLASRRALRRVSAEAEPFFGGGSSTPARRAFERPIAMACLVDRAPCLPSRM